MFTVQRERGERAANALAELAQQFQAQTVIRNRVGILQLLLSLSSLQDANSNYTPIPKSMSATPSPNVGSGQYAPQPTATGGLRPAALQTSTPQSGGAKSLAAANGRGMAGPASSGSQVTVFSGSSSTQQRSAGAALLQRSSGYSSIAPQSAFDLPTLLASQTQSTLVQSNTPVANFTGNTL